MTKYIVVEVEGGGYLVSREAVPDSFVSKDKPGEWYLPEMVRRQCLFRTKFFAIRLAKKLNRKHEIEERLSQAIVIKRKVWP